MATSENDGVKDAPHTASGVLLILALGGTLLAGVAVLGEWTAQSSNRSNSHAYEQAYYLLPHTAILCVALAGFRRSAALAAILVGGVCAFYVSVMALLTLSPALLWFAIFQVALVLAAVPELREWETRFYTLRRRLVGVAAGLGAWCLCAAILVSSSVAQRSAAKARRTNVQQASGQQVGLVWTRGSNFYVLSALAGCVEMFRGVELGGSYPDSIAQVKGWSQQTELGARGCGNLLYRMEPDSAGALAGDYKRFWYSPTSATADPFRAGGFQLEVEATWGDVHEPVPRDMPGTRSFLLDSAGNVHVTAERRRATIADPVLPRCGPRDADNAQCLRWTPRQRWGLHAEYPSANVSISSDSVEPGERVSVQVSFQNQRPLDSIRTADIDWGDGTEITHLRPIGEKSYATTPGGVVLHLPRTFSDTGSHIVTATIAAADGTVYEAEDTIRVYMKNPPSPEARQIRLPTQAGIDDAGQLLAGPEAQTRQAMENVAKAAAAAGTSMDRIERCDIMIAAEKDSRAVTLPFRAAFTGSRLPRDRVMISNNLLIGQHVQIQCYAAP